METIKVTVCELHNDPTGLEQDWLAMIEHLKSEKSDLVLLPEMTFHPWLAGNNSVEFRRWQDAVSLIRR